jgi:hypothetical protein
LLDDLSLDFSNEHHWKAMSRDAIEEAVNAYARSPPPPLLHNP